MAKAARPEKEASGGTAETVLRSVRSVCRDPSVSFRLLRRRGSPPGVVSTASARAGCAGTVAVSRAGAVTVSRVAAAVAVRGSGAGAAGVAAGAGSGLKYLCGTTTTTEVPSQGESAKVTRMP